MQIIPRDRRALENANKQGNIKIIWHSGLRRFTLFTEFQLFLLRRICVSPVSEPLRGFFECCNRNCSPPFMRSRSREASSVLYRAIHRSDFSMFTRTAEKSRNCLHTGNPIWALFICCLSSHLWSNLESNWSGACDRAIIEHKAEFSPT